MRSGTFEERNALGEGIRLGEATGGGEKRMKSPKKKGVDKSTQPRHRRVVREESSTETFR